MNLFKLSFGPMILLVSVTFGLFLTGYQTWAAEWARIASLPLSLLSGFWIFLGAWQDVQKADFQVKMKILETEEALVKERKHE